MASFRSINFIEEDEGPALPGREEDITVTHIPGGNLTNIQSSGNMIQSIETRAVVDRATFNSLVAAVGQTGSATLFLGTHNMRLSKVSPATRVGVDKFRTNLFFYLI